MPPIINQSKLLLNFHEHARECRKRREQLSDNNFLHTQTWFSIFSENNDSPYATSYWKGCKRTFCWRYWNIVSISEFLAALIVLITIISFLPRRGPMVDLACLCRYRGWNQMYCTEFPLSPAIHAFWFSKHGINNPGTRPGPDPCIVFVPPLFIHHHITYSLLRFEYCEMGDAPKGRRGYTYEKFHLCVVHLNTIRFAFGASKFNFLFAFWTSIISFSRVWWPRCRKEAPSPISAAPSLFWRIDGFQWCLGVVSQIEICWRCSSK